MAFSSRVSVRGDPNQTLSVIVEVQTLIDFKAMRTFPGFREVRLLLSEDRSEAMMVTEWESREDYLSWRNGPDNEGVIAHFSRWHPRITFFDVVAAVDVYRTD
jgi:heme-degrading monooxygenase HmoA